MACLIKNFFALFSTAWCLLGIICTNMYMMCIGFDIMEEGLCDKLMILRGNGYLWWLFSLTTISLNWRHPDLAISFLFRQYPQNEIPINISALE